MIFSRFKISGHSMEPQLMQGDNIIASSIPYLFLPPKIQDVVVFEKFSVTYIKRIGIIKDQKYFLIGDNKNDSRDSRSFGFINRSQIKGKMIFKYK